MEDLVIFSYFTGVVCFYLLFAHRWIVKDFVKGKVILMDNCTPTIAAFLAVAAALFPFALISLAYGAAIELVKKWKRSRKNIKDTEDKDV